MAKRDRHHERASASDEIKTEYRKRELDNDPQILDATCVDGATSTIDDDDDDENLDIDWLLEPPSLEIVEEIIVCRKKKSWINLTVQYEVQDSDEFEYEFEIEEIEG